MGWEQCLQWLGIKKKPEVSPVKKLEEISLSWTHPEDYEVLQIEHLNESAYLEIEQGIFACIHEYIGDRHQDWEHIEQLSPGQRAFWITNRVENEVNNGGFNQFYFNGDSVCGEMAIHGFDKLGAPDFAALMTQAQAIYLKHKKKLETYKTGTLADFSESYTDNPWEELDTAFYELDELESLLERRLQYAKRHPEQFCIPRKGK
ncbi:DMP19 family protein [Croceiramulus getboli]|nr:DUF4375 domain-containing protein [Flavobacteriaceae bacterium YJPT1-3]